MSVRDMGGDPRVWEGLSFDDLSGDEKELWVVLGWRQVRCDSIKDTATTEKAWKDLTYQEQGAAMGLGFTEGIWDGFEDE